MNNRLNTNTKAKNSRLFIVIAALIIITGAAIIFFLSSGDQVSDTDNMVVRKSIRVTDPTKPLEGAQATRVTTAPAKAGAAKAGTSKAKTAKVATSKTASVKTVPVKTDPVKTVSEKAAKRDEIYAIHVASFHGEKYARRLERAIDSAGYNAYITTFVKDNVNWYRVRVGFFEAKDDAKKTSAIISKRFKQPGAWIVRPPKDEVEKNKI